MDVSKKYNALARTTRDVASFIDNEHRILDLVQAKVVLARNHKKTLGEIDEKIAYLDQHNKELLVAIEAGAQ